MADADKLTILSSLAHLVDYVIESGEHVFTACPVGSPAREVCFNEGFGLYPVGTTCSGKTLCFPQGGRLTIGADPKDVPDGSVVSFLGWSTAADEMARWRAKAKKVVTFAGTSFHGARAM